jgi:hypothetical protein
MAERERVTVNPPPGAVGPLPLGDPPPLRPYQSFLLLEATDDSVPPYILLHAFVDFLEGQLVSGPGGSRTTLHRDIRDFDPGTNIPGWAYLIYAERTAPSWAPLSGLTDTVHSSAVMVQYKSLIALHTTGDLKDKTRGQIRRGFSGLRPIAADRLNKAFVNGPTRRIWLSGIHGRSVLKPDAKYFGGRDVRHALDPALDQTYHFTAARSELAVNGCDFIEVGVSPSKSSLWMNPSLDWPAFLRAAHTILAVLAHTTEVAPAVDGKAARRRNGGAA